MFQMKRVFAMMRAMPRQLERPKSLTDLAHDSIRQLIVGGELAFGEQLSEQSLAAQLGISKTPVREALLRLRGEGLIDIQPQRGTFVFEMSARDVEEICRFREFLEATALELAMQSDRAALVADLDANVARMTVAHDAQDWRSIPVLDQAFHQLIVDRCDNAYVKQAYRSIAWKIGALRARLPEENERVSHCQDNHAAIVRLVSRGSVAEARASLAEHIRDTLSSYMTASAIGAAAGRPPASATPRRRVARLPAEAVPGV